MPSPCLLVIKLLFINMAHSGAGFIFGAVLTVGSVAGVAAFAALAQRYIIFTGCFSVFCHGSDSPFYV